MGIRPVVSQRRVAAALRRGLDRYVAPLLEDALADGVGSAFALGVITVDGARATCVRGRTARVRQTASGLVAYAGQPITAASAFDLASLTKPMVTSTLLAGAVAGGRLTLDERLDAVLPRAAGTPLGGCTLRSLLGHTSGAIAWHDFYADSLALRPVDRPHAIVDAVLRHPLRVDAAGRSPAPVVYSDLGFIALGQVLEARLGAPLDQLFASEVASPLALDATFRRLSLRPDAVSSSPGRPDDATSAVVATEIWPPRCADGWPLQGHVHDDNCAGLDGVAGHAGLFASVNDVLPWAQAWLRAAVGLPTALGPALPSELVDAWLASPADAAAAARSTWRLGFDTPSTGTSSAGGLVSPTAFGHLGFTGTSVWMDPERRAAVVLLGNRVHPSRDNQLKNRVLRPAVYDAVWHIFDR